MIRWFRRDPQIEARKKRYPCFWCKNLFKRGELELTHTYVDSPEGPGGSILISVWACITNCKERGISL